MVLDHPLRKAFTIEEAALFAADLSEYHSIKNAEAASISQKMVENTTKARLFKTLFLSQYDKKLLDTYDLQNNEDESVNLGKTTFTRTSFVRSLEEHGYSWEAFNLKPMSAYSAPLKYPPLVHDNEHKDGFTSEEICLMVFNIGHVSTIEGISNQYNIRQQEKHRRSKSAFQPNGKLSELFSPVKLTKQSQLIAYSISVLGEVEFLNSLIKNEIIRIENGKASVLEILQPDHFSLYPKINTETTTLTRESIYSYFSSVRLHMQAQLFLPYKEKRQLSSGKVMRELHEKQQQNKRNTTSEIVEELLSLAIENVNHGRKITQSQCYEKYKKQSGDNAQSHSTFCRAISKQAEEIGYSFKNGKGLIKIHQYNI